MVSVCSLFAGIGGIDLALQQAGCEIVWANEKDPYAAMTYRKNFGDTCFIEADIQKINATKLPNMDILVAGFPCQPFSQMGHQRGFCDPRGNLFFDIIRILEAKRPAIVLLENVKNLLQHDDGKTFMTIYNQLAQLGYAVKYKVMNAKEYANIPQDRNRIFMVAFMNYSACDRFTFPEPMPLSKTINDLIDRSEKHNEIYYYRQNSDYYEALKKRVINERAIYRIDDSGIATREYLICPTLKANMGTYHDRVPVIKDHFGIRKLTPMECLKLQGFPSDYSFSKIPLNEAYKQAGNTVCVPLVKRIAMNILQSMREQSWHP